MNWVGGSRNRLVMKNDAKKQREFFEKRKMQQRLKTLGVALPTSPQEETTSGSMDLVTLFIVNQIASKKENKAPPKVAVLGSGKGGYKHKRNEPLVLPMSPCSPSQLSFVESQPLYSVQETRKRKTVIPQGFRCQQLSPVLESAFADNSASDYLPPVTNPVSPFSSTSSASSGPGMFPLQLNLQQRSQTQAHPPPHCSPPPWDTSGVEHTKFQPFSQPRGMTDTIPWSYGSNPPLYHVETPTAAQVLFRSPEPNNTQTRGRHEVTFSCSQTEGREHMLDFTLNQSETEQETEEDLFRGFSTEGNETAASQFGRGKSKIYLKDKTPVKTSTPQTVPDSQCMEVELSNCADMNFSCLEHNNGPMNGCDYSPSSSCREGYLSSDSDEEQQCCQPCLQATSLCMDQSCCAYSLNTNLRSQGNPKQWHPQPRLKLKPNFKDDQKVMENVIRPDTPLGNNSQQMAGHTAQFDSQTRSSEPCKCKKTPSETRDAGTQTVDNPGAATCDASAQCSFAVDSAIKAMEFNMCLPPVDVSVQHPATGGQTYTAAEPNTHTPSPGKAKGGGRHTPWSKKKFRAGSPSTSNVVNKFPADNSDGRVTPLRPINLFLDDVGTANGKEHQSGDEKGQQEDGRPMEDPHSEVRQEVTSATRCSRHSEEAETLQEIADVLLLLQQRRK